jgi:peptidyl-prolyl cis-trans isomerase B (cyclophilin B)
MTTKDQRRRELERQKAQRQAERRLEAEKKRRRRAQIVVWTIVAALVATTVIGLVTSLSNSTDDGAVPATTDEPVAAGTCDYPDNAPNPTLVTDVGRPDSEPGDLGTMTAVMTLNGQDVTMSLDGAAAPCTVNSWEFLAANGYFDDTVCHRLATSDTLGVLQCGDPSGTGGGGPGYRMAEENLVGASYPAGTVAMANTGQPASTGSQFFLVHSDSTLPPQYTVVGTITDGLDVIEEIAAAGTVDGSTDGAPAAGADVSGLVVERSDS